MDPIARPCLLLLLASLIHAMPVCPVWCAEPQSNLNPSSEVAEASAKPQVRVEFSSQFGKQGAGPEEFLGPFGVHVSQDGLVYVGDDLAHTIKVFRKDGSFLNTIGGPALFSYLDKVITDARGRIYVADAGNNKVQVQDPQGKPLKEIRKWGLFGGFKNPRYLSFDGSGRLFVADWGSHCIRVFDQNLGFMQTIGRQGAGDGEFENPIAVAHNSSNWLFVSDFKNHRIQVFDDRGGFLFSFGALGGGPGQLRNPSGLAFDSRGRLFVAEYGNHRVQVFSAKGESLGAFGRQGPGPLEFDKPTDLDFGPDGMLYVAEAGNHRVQVLRVGE